MSDAQPTDEEIVRWVRSICAMAGVRSVQWNDGSIGLVDVPMKYLQVIDAMHQGLVCLASGNPLPRLVPVPVEKKRRKSATGRQP